MFFFFVFVLSTSGAPAALPKLGSISKGLDARGRVGQMCQSRQQMETGIGKGKGKGKEGTMQVADDKRSNPWPASYRRQCDEFSPCFSVRCGGWFTSGRPPSTPAVGQKMSTRDTLVEASKCGFCCN